MKTIALQVEDTIFENVKAFFKLFPKEKIRVVDFTDELGNSKNEYIPDEEMNILLNILTKHGYFISVKNPKMPLHYDINEFNDDLLTLRKLNRIS